MPDPQNTFKGANLEFPNRGVHGLLAEVIKFRKQLTRRQEFKSQSGWNDSLNTFMVDQLEHLALSLSSITYNPEVETQEELETKAADTTRKLSDDFKPSSLQSDNVLMPRSVNRPVTWNLSGDDPDIPQMTPDNCPNDFGRMFITLLDNYFVELTRLDSRNQPQTITKYESTMMRSLLEEMYAITQRKGGEVNRSDTPTGTMATEEPQTFLGS